MKMKHTNNITLWFSRTGVLFSIVFSCFVCRGDHLFIGIMETESYHTLELSVSAFANVCRIPELNDLLKSKAVQLTALPVITGFEKKKRIRIIQTIDPTEPLSDTNPANIAIIPIIDGGKEIERVLTANYKNHSYWRSNITIYDKPVSTNLCELVAVVKEGRFLLTSRSKSALLWANKNKILLNAAPLKQKGTLKLLINPQRVAALLNAKVDPTLLQLLKPVEILQELEICNFAVTLNAQSLTITAEATPLAGTPLITLAKNLKKPDQTLLNSAPTDAFLASISKCEAPEIWNRFALNLQNYVVPALTKLNSKALFTGERVQYLAASQDKKGLIFVQIEPLKDAAAVQQAVNSLDKATASDTLISLEKIKPLPDQNESSCCYKLHLKKNEKKSAPSAIYTIASLFIQHAYLELQIKDNKLITVVGAKESMKEVINNMPGSTPNISLLKELSIKNKALGQNLLTGTKLELSKLLRFTASTIPNITKQQLNILPEGGYGSTFGLTKNDDKTIKGSFQISSDEIAALKNIGTDGRELMQKLLISMLMQRIETMKLPEDSSTDEPQSNSQQPTDNIHPNK